MLKPRILSALIGIPLIILVVWLGGFYLLFFTGLVIIIATWEMFKMFTSLNLSPFFWLALIGNLLLLSSAYFKLNPSGIITLLGIVFFVFLIIFYSKYSLIDSALALTAMLYLSLFIYFYLLDSLPKGDFWLIFLLLNVWATDTTAYFSGKIFGRRPLAPLISPGKTVAGVIGGVAGGLVVTLIFILFYPILPKLPVLFLGLLISVVAQISDLTASIFKRQAKVKDAGKIIPGHGGILDRFDSLFFTSPLVYYYVTFFLKTGE
ncbi:MAG TPA: phosphatidate cytidylyltransferase [Desulfotomaculum sp.]|jgi:phosphatidate cytidylyltransferase|nr:phosphatidate cytidylyltransferase [Desulfotomaculum sp.]